MAEVNLGSVSTIYVFMYLFTFFFFFFGCRGREGKKIGLSSGRYSMQERNSFFIILYEFNPKIQSFSESLFPRRALGVRFEVRIEAATGGVLQEKLLREILQSSQENSYARFSFLIKVQACIFIKKETLAQVFSCELCENSKNTFYTEHLRTTASVRSIYRNLSNFHVGGFCEKS